MMTTAILAAVGTTPAAATLQIAFSNSGGGTFFCADQTACDLDGAIKNVLLINTVVGNIRIEGSFAQSSTSPDALSASSLTITNLGNTTETLTMAVGDTNFVTPVSSIRSSASATFNNDVGGGATLSFFADHANTQPAATASSLPGVPLFSTGITVVNAPDSFSGTHDSIFSQLSGPFSMSEGASLSLLPGASITGFNESMTSIVVPETSTWAMIGIGFGLLALVGTMRPRMGLE
jgi:hypothetical protein